jgi:hypothetical protein
MLLEQLPKVAERLVPDYDLEYPTWLFEELGRVGDERGFPDRVAQDGEWW